MSGSDATHVVRLTPEGRAAIASILVAGPRALEAVGRWFHPAQARSLSEQAIGRIVFGRWQSPDTGEEVVVCRRAAERIEIHCHGGHVAAAQIVHCLSGSACGEISWQQWIRQTAHDPLAAAAQVALAGALTERTALILWDQHAGALRKAIQALAASLAAADVPAALGEVDSLMAYSHLGLHLRQPWRVVLAGAPNVGKSSLVNALLGYPRAIVHDTPGTTRDVLTSTTAFDGWPVELSDTAGLRASSDPLEAAGMGLARERLAVADLIVWVRDASKNPAAVDELPRHGGASVLAIDNKCDLIGATGADRGDCLQVSAIRGDGLEQLKRAIVERLVPLAPSPGCAVPFTLDQIDHLRHIREALASGQIAAAAACLAAFDEPDESAARE